MSAHRCLRCKTETLIALEPRYPDITFFECPVCRRQYALRPGKQLTFRWLHPVSLALYGVIFDPAPGKRAAEVAATFLGQRTAGELEEIVREIRLELEDPTQQVRDILDCRASEPELREYLRLLCEHLERSLGEP